MPYSGIRASITLTLKTDNRGGKRKGAGRPPLTGNPGKRINVYLPEATIAYLKQLGGGKISAGIQKLVERETASE